MTRDAPPLCARRPRHRDVFRPATARLSRGRTGCPCHRARRAACRRGRSSVEHALGRGGCRYPEPADAKAQELHVHSSPVVPRREPGTNHVFEEPEQHPLLVLRRELTGIATYTTSECPSTCPLITGTSRGRPSLALHTCLIFYMSYAALPWVRYPHSSSISKPSSSAHKLVTATKVLARRGHA